MGMTYKIITVYNSTTQFISQIENEVNLNGWTLVDSNIASLSNAQLFYALLSKLTLP